MPIVVQTRTHITTAFSDVAGYFTITIEKPRVQLRFPCCSAVLSVGLLTIDREPVSVIFARGAVARENFIRVPVTVSTEPTSGATPTKLGNVIPL